MLIVSLKEINELEKLYDLVDGIVVYTSDFSSFYNKAYNLEEIKYIYSLKKNLVLFIDLSQMMENSDIERLSVFLDALKDFDINYIYSDLGVHQLLKDKGMENRGIYNPSTLITNEYDLAFYLNQNMLSAGVSLEIPVKDIIQISEKNNHNLFLKAFGYHQMFHSKRHLINLYLEHIKKDHEIDNQNSYLREQKREDLYHIYQSNKGTLLFRSYVINYIDYIKEINPKYIFLDNIFINSKEFLEVVEIYSKYLSNIYDLETSLDLLNKFSFKIEDGFKYQDTVYQKEK
jgi:collagenase-like PrtC family protease